MNKLYLFVVVLLLITPLLSFGQYYRAGDQCAEFSLPDTSGDLVSLSDFSENIVCIYFWMSS